MTTEELRATANEFASRIYRERESDPAFNGRHKYYGTDVVDAFMAGAAFVRPADDGEPVSEEWLLTAGATHSPAAIYKFGRLSIWRHTGGWYVDVNRSLPIHFDCLTRGRVRLFLAALGVPAGGEGTA